MTSFIRKIGWTQHWKSNTGMFGIVEIEYGVFQTRLLISNFFSPYFEQNCNQNCNFNRMPDSNRILFVECQLFLNGQKFSKKYLRSYIFHIFVLFSKYSTL